MNSIQGKIREDDDGVVDAQLNCSEGIASIQWIAGDRKEPSRQVQNWISSKIKWNQAKEQIEWIASDDHDRALKHGENANFGEATEFGH